MDLPLAYHQYKLFLLFEALKKFSLIIYHGYYSLPFPSSYCFIMFAASSGFSTFSASTFKSVTKSKLLYVPVMSRTRFRVIPHSIVACMPRNFSLEAGVKSEV